MWLPLDSFSVSNVNLAKRFSYNIRDIEFFSGVTFLARLVHYQTATEIVFRVYNCLR